jgi:ATP-binding protein involved in chromosome partitioning
MKINRKEVLKSLEQITVPGEGANMVESGAVKNVLTFGDEVVVEVSITNPAMQARKDRVRNYKLYKNKCI